MNSTTKPSKQPQDAMQIVKGLLRSEIDGRTKEAQAFLATRSVVGKVGHGNVTQALLQDQLAALAVGQALVIADIAQSKGLLSDGELSPLFAQLGQLETSIVRISKHLQSLDEAQAKPSRTTKAKSKSDDATIDISTLFCDADEVDE